MEDGYLHLCNLRFYDIPVKSHYNYFLNKAQRNYTQITIPRNDTASSCTQVSLTLTCALFPIYPFPSLVTYNILVTTHEPVFTEHFLYRVLENSGKRKQCKIWKKNKCKFLLEMLNPKSQAVLAFSGRRVEKEVCAHAHCLSVATHWCPRTALIYCEPQRKSLRSKTLFP